jgi:hypothetical protein
MRAYMKKERSLSKNAGSRSKPWWIVSLILSVVILGVGLLRLG